MKDVLVPVANKTVWLGDGMKCGGGCLGESFPRLGKIIIGRKGVSALLGLRPLSHNSASRTHQCKHSVLPFPLLTGCLLPPTWLPSLTLVVFIPLLPVLNKSLELILTALIPHIELHALSQSKQRPFSVFIHVSSHPIHWVIVNSRFYLLTSSVTSLPQPYIISPYFFFLSVPF